MCTCKHMHAHIRSLHYQKSKILFSRIVCSLHSYYITRLQDINLCIYKIYFKIQKLCFKRNSTILRSWKRRAKPSLFSNQLQPWLYLHIYTYIYRCMCGCVSVQNTCTYTYIWWHVDALYCLVRAKQGLQLFPFLFTTATLIMIKP